MIAPARKLANCCLPGCSAGWNFSALARRNRLRSYPRRKTANTVCLFSQRPFSSKAVGARRKETLGRCFERTHTYLCSVLTLLLLVANEGRSFLRVRDSCIQIMHGAMVVVVEQT